MNFDQIEYGSAKKKMWLSGITSLIFIIMCYGLVYIYINFIGYILLLEDHLFTNKFLFISLFMTIGMLWGIIKFFNFFVCYWITAFGKNVKEYQKEKKQEVELNERIKEKSI